MHKVVIDVEKIKDLYSGLGQFCQHLVNNFEDKASYTYLAPLASASFLPRNSPKVQSRFWHRWGVGLPDTGVWHAVHQDVKVYPGKGQSRIVLTIHDLNYTHQNKDNPTRVRTYLKNLQKKIDLADHVVFISNYTRSEVAELLNLDKVNHSVIYNGVALGSDLADPVAVPFNEGFLFSIGKMHPKKNLHLLIQALEFLPDQCLVLAGDNNSTYGRVLEAHAHRSKARERIFFCGQVSDAQKHWLYKKSSFMLMPSMLEGFGLPVVEAHALGTPTILSKKTSLPEIGGEASFYFDELNPASMAKKIIECHDLVRGKGVDLASLQKNAQRFSWKKSALAYEKIYRELS